MNYDKKMIKTHPALLLHAYTIGTVLASCSSIKSSIGKDKPDIESRVLDLSDDTKREILAFFPAKKIAADLRRVDRRWKRVANKCL